MRRRILIAVVAELILVGFLVGMFIISVDVVRQDRDWREQGVGVGPVAQLAIDVSTWWLKYWWAVAPLVLVGGFGLAAMIVFTGRKGIPSTA